MFMEIFDQPYNYFFETSNPIRTIKLEVEVIPDKVEVLYNFLKAHPGILKNWEQSIMKVEQELYSISF